MACALKGEQHMLDPIELHVIASEPCDMVRQSVALRADVSHMVRFSHLPDTGGGHVLAP